MQYIGIFVNQDRDKTLSATKKTVSALLSYGKSVLVDQSLKGLLPLAAEFVSHREMLERAELIIALGGDGTLLKIIGDAAAYNIPVIGINLGHLGFLAQAEKDETDVFKKIVNGDFTVTYTMMLEAKIRRDGSELSSCFALNDIILRGGGARMISLEVEVDGTVTNRYLADGIIAATSTGSTAYSLSCGGPIVHPSLDCMILTPICPHTLKSRCIVIPPEASVVLRFDPAYCLDADLRADGRTVACLNAGDSIEIVRAKQNAPLVTLNGHSYFDVIRRKLSD